VLKHRHGHVSYVSSQFRAGIRAPAVGKVDEIHNLNLTTRTGAEVSDQLKYFAERLPATFVYAGINVEAEGLFAGVRGRQIADLFTLIASAPFAYGTTDQRTTWRALLSTLETTLRLHHHAPGTRRSGLLPKIPRHCRPTVTLLESALQIWVLREDVNVRQIVARAAPCAALLPRSTRTTARTVAHPLPAPHARSFSRGAGIAGLFGGGLHATTGDGWTIDVVSPEWPHDRVLLSADGGSYDGPPGGTWWHIFDANYSELRAAGFSPSGQTLAVATISDLTLWTRAENDGARTTTTDSAN
jgi:hypothetical protein